MTNRNVNWKLAFGLVAGLAAGLAAALFGGGRPAMAQSDDGKGKPVGIAIFKDPEQLGSPAYAYILYDSGRVDRKPLKSVAGN